MNSRWGRIFWLPENCSGGGDLEEEDEGLLGLEGEEEERSFMGVDMVGYEILEERFLESSPWVGL